MGTNNKEVAILRRMKKINDEHQLPKVPEDSPYWPVREFLAQADESASGELALNPLREVWNRKEEKKKPKTMKVQVYGFPDLHSSPRLAVGPGLGKKKIDKIRKKRPDIPEIYLQYFQYFGEIIPIHMLPKKALLFGLGGGVWDQPLESSEKVREFINGEYWAAAQEEFPGAPAVLLGFDGKGNLWFGSDENEKVWIFDKNIQDVRNANYYDHDDVESIKWPEFCLRILKRWTGKEKKRK